MAVKYFKLGKKASMFFDPSTRMKVIKTKPAKLEFEGQLNRKISEALAGNGLIEISEEEYDAILENPENEKFGPFKSKPEKSEDDDDDDKDDDDKEDDDDDDDDDEPKKKTRKKRK